MLSNFFPSAARADQNFRNGLLQGFTAANKLAKNNYCLVRKFAVLTAPLSIQNGELNADGSVSFQLPLASLNLSSLMPFYRSTVPV